MLNSPPDMSATVPHLVDKGSCKVFEGGLLDIPYSTFIYEKQRNSTQRLSGCLQEISIHLIRYEIPGGSMI